MSEESNPVDIIATVKILDSRYAGLVKVLDKSVIALEELANKVVNLANKLEEHMLERDAHNPGTMRTK
jgi:hypothetical protein